MHKQQFLQLQLVEVPCNKYSESYQPEWLRFRVGPAIYRSLHLRSRSRFTVLRVAKGHQWEQTRGSSCQIRLYQRCRQTLLSWFWGRCLWERQRYPSFFSSGAPPSFSSFLLLSTKFSFWSISNPLALGRYLSFILTWDGSVRWYLGFRGPKKSFGSQFWLHIHFWRRCFDGRCCRGLPLRVEGMTEFSWYWSWGLQVGAWNDSYGGLGHESSKRR